MRRRLLSLVCLIVLGLTCLIAVPRAPLAETPAEKKLLKSADRVAQKVAKIRGLAVRKPIKRGVMDKKELEKRLLERVSQEYSPDELVAEELLLKRFGLLEPETRYLDVVIDLLTEQIAGFYDPWEKQLYIANFQTVGGEILMAHEIDHALQDQHFDLRKFMDAGRNASDAAVARQALVEGDGMALMIELMLANMKQPPPWGNDAVVEAISSQMKGAAGFGKGFDKAPLLLREGLIFPYLAGLRFVAHFRKTRSWKRIDAMYKKPPLSTEHVLHPKLYESYEQPDRITATTLSWLPGLVVRHHDVNGELGTMIFLMAHGVPRAKAELAAAGWGGDRAAVLTPKKSTALESSVGGWKSSWDTEADAIEFHDAAVDALTTLAGPAAPMATGSSGGGQGQGKAQSKGLRFGSSQAAIERRGLDVVIVINAPSAALPKVVDEVFGSWRVQRR